MRTRLVFLLGGALVGTSLVTTFGCARLIGGKQPTQTPFMESVDSRFTALELRYRLNEQVVPIAEGIEFAADRIRAESTDPQVRRQALLWKMEAIPAVHRAAFHHDPLAAAIDVWLLLQQQLDFLTEGEGRDLFGPQQPIAVEEAERLMDSYESYWRQVAHRPERIDDMVHSVEDVARRHPLKRGLTDRPTAISELIVELADPSRNALAVVGEVSNTLADLSSRANVYLEHATKLARWNAELLAEEMSTRLELDSTLTNIERSLSTLDEAALMAKRDDLDPLLSQVAEETARVLIDEGTALADNLEKIRLETLAYITNEREALVAVIRAERVAAFADVTDERLAALDSIEEMRLQTISDSREVGQELIDYAVRRVGLLAVGIVVLTGVMMLIGFLVIRRVAPHKQPT